MEYKKHYTDAELDELLKWFDERWDKLPTSIRDRTHLYIPDFKHTLRLYYDIVHEHKDNPTYSTQIHQVFQMRDWVIAYWKEHGGEPAGAASDAAATPPSEVKA